MRSSMQYAVAGASLLSGAFAAPASYAAPSYGFTSAAPAATAASGSYGSFATLIPQGFPVLTTSELDAVQVLAHGTEPSKAPPPSLSKQSEISFRFIHYNENMEVSYFAQWVNNVTHNVPGYELAEPERTFVIDALTENFNTEILHAVNARTVLNHFGRTVVDPCNYAFPVHDGEGATTLANTFTDMVLGTLQDVENRFTANGDNGFPAVVGSVIGNEAEQNAFYRLLRNQKLLPASLPYMTASNLDFAFTAVTSFVVGECAATQTIIKDGLKLYAPLNLLTPTVAPQDQVLQFSFDIATLTKTANIPFSTLFGSYPSLQSWGQGTYNAGFNWANSGLYLQYVNAQNVPLGVPLLNPTVSGTVVTFNANFPYTENLMNGLTIGAITVGTNFTDVNAVAANALFGPALLEVN